MARSIALVLLPVLLLLFTGCVQYFGEEFQTRIGPASDQKILSEALSKTLKQLELKENLDKLARLKDKTVAVNVAVMPCSGAEKDAAEVVRAALIKRLILNNIKPVDGASVKPDFRIDAIVEVMGIDVLVTAFPHYWLALYCRHRRTASVRISISAYSMDDYLPQMDLSLEDEVEYVRTRLLWLIKW